MIGVAGREAPEFAASVGTEGIHRAIIRADVYHPIRNRRGGANDIPCGSAPYRIAGRITSAA